MSDPRSHRAGQTDSLASGVPAPEERWTVAVENAVRPRPRVGTGAVAHPRRRIIDALVQSVARDGYERTTVAQISRLAEVPEPVFEEHFASKEDCLIAALNELIGGLHRIVLERVAGGSSWVERVRLGLQTLLMALACHPDGARVALVEYLSAGEPAVTRMRSAATSVAQAVDAGRAQTVDAGYLPPQTSEAVVGGIVAILHRRVLEGDTAELPELLPDLLYFALHPFLGHERAITAAGLTASAAA